MPTMTQQTPPAGTRQRIFGGVDTHGQTHTAAVVTDAGAMLAARQFPADAAGYRQLTSWLTGHGQLVKIGVEGTGSYGAGLTRHLQAAGHTVIEVNQPDKAVRRRVGKSDPIDAEAAARAALSGRAAAIPKDTTAGVEALRNLRVARNDAIKHRADTQRRLRSMLVTAPEPVKAALAGLTILKLTRKAAAFRPDLTAAAIGDVTAAVKLALASLARTWLNHRDEIHQLDKTILPLVKRLAPHLLARPGVGPDVASRLLVTAGQNAHRLHSEAALAALTGVSPVPASSGKTNRHRLNRGGDRQANNAIWRIAMTRMAHDATTKQTIERHLARGKTKKEAVRILKRAIIRDIYRALRLDMP